MLQIALFAHTNRQLHLRELVGARLLVKSTSQVDLKWLVMKLMASENFDSDAATDRLDPTWKTQVNLSRLDRPDSQV